MTRTITKLFGGLGHGEAVPAYFGDDLGEWERVGVGKSIYERRQYDFGGDRFAAWVEVSVDNSLSREVVFWFTRALLDVSIEKQREVLHISMEATGRYANIINLAGYAGLFAVWTQLCSGFTPVTNLGVALLLILSISCYVGLEVLGMVIRSFSAQRIAKAVAGPSEDFESAMDAHRDLISLAASRIGPTQNVVMFVALGSAVAAFGVLASAVIHGLLLQMCMA